MTDADRVAIVGISGTGKSTRAKKFVTAELEHGRRVVVFDPEGEWHRGCRRPRVLAGPCASTLEAAELFRDPKGWLDRSELSLAVVPSDDDEEAGEELADLVELVRHTGDVLLVVEEVGGVCRESDAARKALTKLATKGRHWGVPSVFVSQRMVDIPIGARAQLTQLESFTQTQEADLSALADRVSKDFAEGVRALPIGESIVWRALTREGGRGAEQ
jgi:DNA helicase HerA-like ATPase